MESGYEIPISFGGGKRDAGAQPQTIQSKQKTCVLVVLVVLLGMSILASGAALALSLVPKDSKKEASNTAAIQDLKVKLAAIENSNFQQEKLLNSSYQRIDILEAMNDHLGNDSRLLQTRYGEIATTIDSRHREEDEVQCPQNYTRNPYSHNCIRLVSLMKSWQDAKTHCESDGEKLATFESLESAFWLINQRKNDPAWSATNVWVGGKQYTATVWKWYGKSTGTIDNLPWGPDQPDNHNGIEDCVDSAKPFHYKFNDHVCINRFPFLCER